MRISDWSSDVCSSDLAHLLNASYSGSGYSADTRVLAQVSDEELIASAAQAEESDRIGQSDVWQVLVRDDPQRAFRALVADQRRGLFEAARWEPLLSQYSYQDRKSTRLNSSH